MLNTLMDRNVSILDKESCTGCGACYNACPVNAIEMKPDELGFLVPVINFDKCIKCGKCVRCCPKFNYVNNNSAEPDCYAAWANDDVRKVSSSGGIFYELAKYVIEQKGIVCAVTMTEDFIVKHICIDCTDDIGKVLKSKYIQSDVGNVYSEIKSYAKENKMILFVGTPCQVVAAKNIIGDKLSDNVIYVDCLCGGVPSNKMWQDYLQENFTKEKIKSVDFRNKDIEWKNSSSYLTVDYIDGNREVIYKDNSTYEWGFHSYLIKRRCCKYCDFAGYQRPGDLTIGDFWCIDRLDASMDDGKGTSVVLLNNDKGTTVFNKIKDRLHKIQKRSVREVYGRIHKETKFHPMYERFRELYKTHGFTDSVDYCIKEKYDIGLVGNWCGINYGSTLTHYSLYNYLTTIGKSVLMIKQPESSFYKDPSKPTLFRVNPYKSWACGKSHKDLNSMRVLNRQIHTFIVGSDQLFECNLWERFGKFSTLGFVSNIHKKISYATSFGHSRIHGHEHQRVEMQYFLKKFNFLSVREDSGVYILKDEYDCIGEQVLDPVFLMSKEAYENLLGNSQTVKMPKDYIICYVLDINNDKENIINKISECFGMEAFSLKDAWQAVHNTGSKWSVKTLACEFLEDWLSYIANSKFVVVDSFHGMCMAILFHKEFIVIANRRRGVSRFDSLLGLLGLKARMIYSFKELEGIIDNLQPINYEKVDNILDEQRNKSKKWIQSALDFQLHKVALSDYDGIDNELNKLTYEIKILNDEINRLKKITWVQTKFIRGMQCVKDNGIIYTIKRVCQKLKNRRK